MGVRVGSRECVCRSCRWSRGWWLLPWLSGGLFFKSYVLEVCEVGAGMEKVPWLSWLVRHADEYLGEPVCQPRLVSLGYTFTLVSRRVLLYGINYYSEDETNISCPEGKYPTW